MKIAETSESREEQHEKSWEENRGEDGWKGDISVPSRLKFSVRQWQIDTKR